MSAALASLSATLGSGSAALASAADEAVTSGGATVGGLAALAAAALWAIGVVLFGRALSSTSSEAPTAAAANLFKNTLALACFGIAWLATGAELPPPRACGLLLVSGVLGFTAGDTLYFAAVPRCGAHVTAMLGNLAVPVAVLLGFVFLGESLELGVLAAMGVVVLGVLLVLTGRKSGRAGGVVLAGRGERWSGGLVAAASAACQGVAIAIGHEGFEGVGVLAGIEIRLAGGVASAFVVALLVDLPRSRGELRGLVRPFASRSLGLALVVPSIFAALLTLPLHGLGLREAPSGVAAVLFSTTPLFTLPIAWSLGERPTARTLLGTAIGFAGVVGVILLGHDGAP